MFGLRHAVIFLAQCWSEPEGRREALSQKNCRPDFGAGLPQVHGMGVPVCRCRLTLRLAARRQPTPQRPLQWQRPSQLQSKTSRRRPLTAIHLRYRDSRPDENRKSFAPNFQETHRNSRPPTWCRHISADFDNRSQRSAVEGHGTSNRGIDG